MDKFCADIHNNLSITLTSSGIKIGHCCWDKGWFLSTNKNYWTDPRLVNSREFNRSNNQLPAYNCQQCIYMENHGGASRRSGVNTYYKETLDVDSITPPVTGPRGLEIKIDYTCNIACVYCGPYNSTQWRLEEGTNKKTFPIRLKTAEITEMLDNLDLSNLDNIHFYGGDPLLTNTHETILNYIDDRVGLKNIYVWYNTNGTIKVSQRVIDLWSKCRLIKVYFSIDDVGARFEYIRYGAVWNEVEDNMLWFKENCPVNTMFSVQPTLSCLNALDHYELVAWKNTHFPSNRLGDSTTLTRHNVFGSLELNAIPLALMSQCLERNSKDPDFCQYLASFKFSHVKYDLARKKIAELNQRRNLDFASIFPDLAQYYI